MVEYKKLQFEFLYISSSERWRQFKCWASKERCGQSTLQREGNGNGDETTCNCTKNLTLLQPGDAGGHA